MFWSTLMIPNTVTCSTIRLVQALLTGAMFQVDEESFDGAFYTGPLREPKAELKKLLRDILSRHDQVQAGFMTVLYQPHSAYTPHPAVGLACDGDRSWPFKTAGRRFRPGRGIG